MSIFSLSFRMSLEIKIKSPEFYLIYKVGLKRLQKSFIVVFTPFPFLVDMDLVRIKISTYYFVHLISWEG